MLLKIRAALSKAELSKQVPSILQYMGTLTKIGHQVSHLYKLLRPNTFTINDKAIKYWETQGSSPLVRQIDNS